MLRTETQEGSIELDSLEISEMRSDTGNLGSPGRPRDKIMPKKMS